MVGLVYTTILTTDNKAITIPNGTLSNSTVTNVTAMDKRMLELKVGIAYEADIRTAKAVLERVYREHPMVKKDEDIKVFVDSLGDSSVVLGIRGWVETSDYWQTRWDILERIKLSFDAPLAYMRGRTLDDSFIILDEAQNTSREQMKMFLTRLGFGSKIVITGDVTQIDLPADKVSGLREAMRVLNGVEDIAICRLSGADVVRHVIVQRIIKAYEEDEHRRKSAEGKRDGR